MSIWTDLIEEIEAGEFNKPEPTPGSREWLNLHGPIDRDLLILERIAELKTHIKQLKNDVADLMKPKSCCRDRSGLCESCPSR